MVTQQDDKVKLDEIQQVLRAVVSVEAEVKGLREDNADLKKDIATLSKFMFRVETLEQERNHPAKIAELNARIDTLSERTQKLETAQRTAEATKTGQWSVWHGIVAVAALISLLLSIAVAAKEIWGK